MAQPYIGEIRIFAGNFAPAGWSFCDGQLMPISENDALFTLIGTTYGGDGQETFALPNLQSRFPIHQGTGPAAGGINRVLGELGGVEAVTLTTQQIPVHTHAFLASQDSGQVVTPGGNVIGLSNAVSIFKPIPGAPNSPLNAASITPVGGSQPHDNMHPYLTVSYIISLFGLFPRFS